MCGWISRSPRTRLFRSRTGRTQDAKKSLITVDVSAVLIETRLGEYLVKPGDYELKVVVTDNVSKKTAEASGTFFVTGTLPPKKK